MYKSKNRSKYSLKAHIIFVIKYRKKILSPKMASAVKNCILKIAERSNFNVETMEVNRDHIHLLVDYEPKLSLLAIVRRLKQESTHQMWRTHRKLLKKHFWKENTFWSDGYFVCSIGEGASYETIQQYIRS